MMTITQMSVTAAILILIIAVVRSLAVHRLPKITFVALWGVALLRLLTPFSVPLPWSFDTVADKTAEFIAESPVIQRVATIPPSAANMDAIGYPAVAATPELAAAPEIAAAAANADLSLTAVWLIGVTACALFFLITHLRCVREYKTAIPLEDAHADEYLRSRKLRRAVQIRYSDKLTAPMTYGIFKPVILLPKTAERHNGDELRYVLAHELTHIRRFDVLIKWLLAAALCVHWFNPLVWVMYILANRDVELSCDETVIRRFGVKTKTAYAYTLIGLAETRSKFAPLYTGFSKNATEERIVAIMKTNKRTWISAALAVALVAVLTIGVLAAAGGEPVIEPDDALAAAAPTDDVMEIDYDYTSDAAPFVQTAENYLSVIISRMLNDDIIEYIGGGDFFSGVTEHVKARDKYIVTELTFKNEEDYKRYIETNDWTKDAVKYIINGDTWYEAERTETEEYTETRILWLSECSRMGMESIERRPLSYDAESGCSIKNHKNPVLTADPVQVIAHYGRHPSYCWLEITEKWRCTECHASGTDRINAAVFCENGH